MKNVLIIGASGDIGSAIVKELAKEEYSFILHYHQNKQSIETLIEQLDEAAILQVIQADLTTDKGVISLYEQLIFTVHAIIFVSGTAQHGLFQNVSEKMMEDMVTLHVKSPWVITQKLLPAMIKRQSGKIIFITSIWGNTGASNEVIYSSVKGAQNSFVKALAKEVGPNGISVNAVSPGFIDTKMNSHLLEDEREAIISNIPANRIGLPDEIAHAVRFLMDEKSNYILGEIIQISGGWY